MLDSFWDPEIGLKFRMNFVWILGRFSERKMIPEANPTRARLEIKAAFDFDAISGSMFDLILDEIRV